MLEKLTRDKHSSLLQKFVKYREKSFITLPPVSYGRKVFIISAPIDSMLLIQIFAEIILE
jgi:hypothetical protein